MQRLSPASLHAPLRPILSCLLVSLAALVVLPLAPTAEASDGATTTLAPEMMDGPWRIEAEPGSERSKPFRDAVLIEGGVFTSEAFAMYGFAPGPAVVTEGTLVVRQISQSRGSLIWCLSPNGAEISGTLHWHLPDGSVNAYNVRGTPIVVE